MAYSLMRIVSDGTLSTIALTFPFFDKTHVAVSVGPSELPGGGYTFVWLNPTTIKITPAVSVGVEVVVRRRTPFNGVFNEFSAGAVFNEYSMDENFRQLLFNFQEVLESNKSTDVYNDLNLHGYRVSNVANAITGRDAVPYSQYQADTQGAYQQRLVCEQYSVVCQQQSGIATTAANTAASDAVASSNVLIVSTANAAATTTAANLIVPIDARITTLEARKSTCLVNATGTGAPHETVVTQLPANVVVNNRYVLPNPFGTAPVICWAEVFLNGKWADTGFIYSSGGWGVSAVYVQGEGIIVQTGSSRIWLRSADSGGGHGMTTDGTTPSPCRVFVRKLEA